MVITNSIPVLLKHWSRRGGVLLIGGVLSSTVAQAEESRWRFSSYGTLGYTVDDHRLLAPMRDLNQEPEQDYETDRTWKLDSRLGAQLTYTFNDELVSVGQISLRPQPIFSWNGTVELAYLDWQTQPNWAFRLGRVGYDAFLMSDHRNLGYGYSWVRPPLEYYGWIPIYSVDGLDLTYSRAEDDANWQLRLQAGQSSPVTIPWGEQAWVVTDKQFWMVNLSRQSESWEWKVSYTQYRIGTAPASFIPLLDGLKQVADLPIPAVSREASELHQALDYLDSFHQYFSLGLRYDDGLWFGQVELGRVKAEAEGLVNADMGYLVAGRRWDSWSPYLMYARSKPQPIRVAQSDWGAISPELGGLQEMAVRLSNVVRADQSTLSAGVRWDFNPNLALKAQWDYTQIKSYGYMLWFRTPESQTQEHSVNLFSLSLDFVF